MTSLKDGISTLRQHKKWCKEEQTNSIELTVTVIGQSMPVKNEEWIAALSSKTTKTFYSLFANYMT